MSPYFIRPVGFPESKYTGLEAILTIARARLYDDWRWTFDGPPDIYLVAVESPCAWHRHRTELPRDRLLACILPHLEVDARWRVQLTQTYLPSFGEFTQILNIVGAELARPVSAIMAEPMVPGIAPVEAYEPGDYLAGIIRDCQLDGLPRRLTCGNDDDAVLIDPGQGLYFISGADFQSWPLLFAARDRIQAQPLDDEQLAHAISAADAGKGALNDLIFLSVLLGSRGRLWAGCRRDEPVRLKQWPSFRHFSRDPGYLRLMAFMSGNLADIGTIAARVGVCQGKAIDFHNACMALNLLDRGGEASVREKAVNPEIRALYGKIARRLQGEA